MAVTDHANDAAVVAAGYRKVQVDRTAALANAEGYPRFLTRYEKPSTGPAGDSGRLMVAEGESDVSAAAADTQAVAALNAQRRHNYGGSPGRASGGAESNSARGGAHTADLT